MQIIKVVGVEVHPTLVEDESGNKLAVSKTGVVTLSLAKEGQRTRTVGRLQMSAKGHIIFKRSSLKEEIHVFRKFEAWGFHHAILEELSEDAWLVAESDVDTYGITVREARAVAKFMHFKAQGFEKQAFIPLTAFKRKSEEGKPKEIA